MAFSEESPLTLSIVNIPGYHVPVPGFTQAVKASVGGATWLYVSGLTSRDSTGEILHVGDAAKQARQILVSLKAILAQCGGDLTDVVRIVTYLTNIDHHPAVHAVRREFFGDDPPASTSVEVSRLYDQRQLIEIEATAILL